LFVRCCTAASAVKAPAAPDRPGSCNIVLYKDFLTNKVKRSFEAMFFTRSMILMYFNFCTSQFKGKSYCNLIHFLLSIDVERLGWKRSCGYGSSKIMRSLADPAPQHWVCKKWACCLHVVCVPDYPVTIPENTFFLNKRKLSPWIILNLYFRYTKGIWRLYRGTFLQLKIFSKIT
jgi:hypothetical protein